MKKILIYIAAIMLILCFAVVPVFATEVETEVETAGEETTPHQSAEQTQTSDVASATESVFSPRGEASEEDATEQEESIETVESTETGAEVTENPESETEDLAAIIEGADSKLDAIFAIASAMGISPEEAEAFLDKMVSLGDEHFGESDLWADVKASIAEDPEAWTVAALVVLMLMVLVIFIIRGLIKNTIAQSATKANITDIKTVLGINKDSGKSETLEGLKNDILGLKRNTERLELENMELKADLELQSEAIKAAVGEVLDAVRAENVKLDTIEGETAASVKINGEQALQIVQLLNIAMGRQMPRMSETTRKAWYDESVTKIKEAAGIKDATDGEK